MSSSPAYDVSFDPGAVLLNRSVQPQRSRWVFNVSQHNASTVTSVCRARLSATQSRLGFALYRSFEVGLLRRE
jgi:hypothetical protein